MRIVFATMAGLLASSVASAQGDLRSACRGDHARLCAAHRLGTPEAETCLRANGARASQTCRAALSAARTPSAAPPSGVAPVQRGSDYR